MDKGHKKQADPKGICQKIRNTLSLSPALQSVWRVSYFQQEITKPASTASALPPSEDVPGNKRGNGVVIPIEFDRSAFAREKQKHRHIAVEEKTKDNPMPSQGHGEFILRKDSESDNTMNERFSDFINRGKQQIGRTSSDIGGGGVKRLDSVNKKASAYIDRARQRIRKSSTFGASSSFKHKD